MLKNIIKYIKQNLAPISVVFICMYALYLRLMLLAQRALGQDDIWQLNQMRGSFFELLKSIPMNEVCSYLSGDYYLIYPFFKIFGYNRWGLAIPHILFTILGFYILYLICRRYFKTIWGYLITFIIVCFNDVLISHATVIRVYAVLPTLVLASLYLSQLLIDKKFQLSIGKKIATGLFFIMLIWFHVYGILIFFCTLIFALLNRKKDDLTWPLMKELFKFVLILLIIAMPFWLYSVFGPRYGLGQNNMDPNKYLRITEFKMTVTDYIPSPLMNPLGFLKAVFGNLVGLKKLYFLLLGVIFPFILPLKNRLKLILLFIIAVLVPIISLYIFDNLVVYFFIPRQFIWVIPIFAFYLGWSWDSFFEFLKHRRAP